jgi:hypothetical protein
MLDHQNIVSLKHIYLTKRVHGMSQTCHFESAMMTVV